MKRLTQYSTLILLGACSAGILTFAKTRKLDFIRVVHTSFAEAAPKSANLKKTNETKVSRNDFKNSEIKTDVNNNLSSATKVTQDDYSEKLEFVRQAPSRTLLRSEVQNNLHQTPQSFIQFAKKFAAPMTLAETDSTFAVQLFSELSECALSNSPETAKLVRAFCFEQAHMVSLMHPQVLSDLFKSLNDKTDSEIIQLTQRSRASQQKETATYEKQ